MFSKVSSWFNSRDSVRPSRKSLALNSTRDAFSLPTHSPTLAAHHYASRTASTDNFVPEGGETPSYTYPPQSREDPYDYLANSSFEIASKGNNASLLPLHHSSLPPLQLCPPLSHTWNRIHAWLSEDYEELGDTFNYSVLEETLQEVEAVLGFSLPSSLRESYLIIDGQEPESLNSGSEGLFFGLTFLPLEDALEEWKFWRNVDIDQTTGGNPHLQQIMQSVPPGYIRREYSNRGWFPVVTDKAGNYLGVDVNPDESGSVGQVIVFGRDFDMKVVMWKAEGEGGWGRWLAMFADELEAGETFDSGNASGGDASDDSDDGLGYDGYFFDTNQKGAAEGGGKGRSGGLRLTGEYRGWPVLEALADRSYRQWANAGVLMDRHVQSPSVRTNGSVKNKGKERYTDVTADDPPIEQDLPSKNPYAQPISAQPNLLEGEVEAAPGEGKLVDAGASVLQQPPLEPHPSTSPTHLYSSSSNAETSRAVSPKIASENKLLLAGATEVADTVNSLATPITSSMKSVDQHKDVTTQPVGLPIEQHTSSSMIEEPSQEVSPTPTVRLVASTAISEGVDAPLPVLNESSTVPTISDAMSDAKS